MKLKKAQTIVIFFFALALIVFLVHGYFGRKNYDKFMKTTMQNCLQLKVGMNRDEVKTIMGKARSIQDSEFEGVVYEEWVFDAPITVSVPPMCSFDKEKGILVHISCSG